MPEYRYEVVDASKLRPGPIRHAALPDWFLIRTQLVSHVLGGEIWSFHDLVENFQRDANPEGELQIFERMAAAFLILTGGRAVSSERNRELVGGLLNVSMLPMGNLEAFDANTRPIAEAYYHAAAPGQAELVSP